MNDKMWILQGHEKHHISIRNHKKSRKSGISANRATHKKSLFPVQQVARMVSSRATAKSFFPLFFVRNLSNFLGGKKSKNAKNSQTARKYPRSRWTGNKLFLKDGLATEVRYSHFTHRPPTSGPPSRAPE